MQKGAEADDAGAAAEYLENIGALDDAAYAAMLVRHYSAQGCGSARIRDELYRRGVPRELWGAGAGNSPRRAGDACARHRVENEGEAPERKGL